VTAELTGLAEDWQAGIERRWSRDYESTDVDRSAYRAV
jgi:hypothetical protein